MGVVLVMDTIVHSGDVHGTVHDVKPHVVAQHMQRHESRVCQKCPHSPLSPFTVVYTAKERIVHTPSTTTSPSSCIFRACADLQ